MISKRFAPRVWARLLAVFVAAAAVCIGAVGAAALTNPVAPTTTSSYKMLGAHVMPTAQEYAAKYRGADFIPGVGSAPVGGHLIYGGGPVVVHPKIFLTFWDWTTDPSNVKPYLTGFFAGVGGSDWLESQTQYCMNVPTLTLDCGSAPRVGNPQNILGGVWDDRTDIIAPNPLAEPQTGNSPPLSDEAMRAVNHFGYGPDNIYLIATPHAHSTAGFAANNSLGGYCAWHGAIQRADGSRVLLINLPYLPDAAASCGANLVNPGAQGLIDPVSVAAGHEYAETITDPTVSFAGIAAQGFTATGWYDPDPALGGENGDKCAYPLFNQAGVQNTPGGAVDLTLNGKQYAVQPLWSNNANNYLGGCVTSYTPPLVALPSLPALPGTASINTSPSTCPGAQLVDPPFDAVDPYTTVNVASSDMPSLDIQSVEFNTPNANTLEITTTVNNLQSFPQGNTLGGVWSVYWDYGGQTYVAAVTSDGSGFTYMDGVHTASPSTVTVPAVLITLSQGTSGASDVFTNTNDTGSFNPGPNGTVVIDVPLFHVGNPAAGSLLTKTWAVAYGQLATAITSSVPGLPTAGNHWALFPSDEAPDSSPLSGGPYTSGPYTGWAYEIGSVTSCSHARALPAPPVDLFKPEAPPSALACGVLWANPEHTASDLLGNSAPQLTLEQGSMTLAPDGKTLQVKMQLQDLEATVPAGATGEDWYLLWAYNGTTYFAQASLSAVPTSSPGFADGTVNVVGSSHQYNPKNTDTGSFNTGPHGTLEIDVPLANVAAPPKGTVLKGPAGETDTEYGLPATPATSGAGSLQKVDSGGPNRDYTVGASCSSTQTLAATSSHAAGAGSGAGSGSGQSLAHTGIAYAGAIVGLLLVMVGLPVVVARRRRGLRA